MLPSRKRPYLVDPVGDEEVCTAKLPDFDYPSGHTTIGWAIGLVFADIAPGNATEILTRARAFGESRVVCGMHNESAVEAGFVAGSAIAAALQGSEAFQSDFKAAQNEVQELRQQSGFRPQTATCAAEAKLVEMSPY